MHSAIAKLTNVAERMFENVSRNNLFAADRTIHQSSSESFVTATPVARLISARRTLGKNLGA